MKSSSCSTPFASIAPYYDRLMSFVNYPSWVAYIEKIIALSNVKEKFIFDLACGTGVCLRLWANQGYVVIGLDKSLSMLQVCREKLLNHDDALLINGDKFTDVEFTAPNISAWLQQGLKVPLKAGTNDIAIQGQWNWMSLDYIAVKGVRGGRG